MQKLNDYPENWTEIAWLTKVRAGWKCIRCGHAHSREGWRVLTVHHLDGDKANCVWWNLLALCQRCHLHIQAKVDPWQPYFFEHAEWFKPYVAGFYAHKYLGQSLTREETFARMSELLNLELVTQ